MCACGCVCVRARCVVRGAWCVVPVATCPSDDIDEHASESDAASRALWWLRARVDVQMEARSVCAKHCPLIWEPMCICECAI